MRWNLKSVSASLRFFAACVSVFTMCMAPVAQGAQAAKTQKQMISEYLKQTGLVGKTQTVGEYWRMVRHAYPSQLRSDMDQWVRLHRLEMMPKIEASSFKDANGVEQVRLTMTKDGQTHNLTFTGNDEFPMKLNAVSISKKEIAHTEKYNTLLRRIAKEDPVIGKSMKSSHLGALGPDVLLTTKEFRKLSLDQKAEYLYRLRLAAESAQKVYGAAYGDQALNDYNESHQWVYEFLMGPDAYAADDLVGKKCIIAGWFSTYGENHKCGGATSGWNDITAQMKKGQASCSGGAVSCNPMVYGFHDDGSPYCIPHDSNIKSATKQCNAASSLQDPDPKKEALNKKRIIESYKKKMKESVDLGQPNDKGEVEQDKLDGISDYISGLKGFIKDAGDLCDGSLKKVIKKYKVPDETEACVELRKRAFDLEGYALDPQPPLPPLPPPPVASTIDCSNQPGKHPSDDGKTCVCDSGSKPPDDPTPAAAGDGSKKGKHHKSEGDCGVIVGAADELPGSKQVVADDTCGFWCRNGGWILPLGAVLVGVGLVTYLATRGGSSTNPPLNVAPTPPPFTMPPPTTVPTVAPPPSNPTCVAPNTLSNGVCVPPVVTVIPPPPASEGGTKTDNGTSAGGTR